MFDNFFIGKKVLVTGVAGVKGSWLALELLEAGSDVVGLDTSSLKSDSNFVASGLRKRIRFVAGDVTNFTLMCDLVGSVDCVFHLAAKALVGEAARNPLQAYRTNTLGTATVLEAIRVSDPVKYSVFVTTDKVYKSKEGQPWVEKDPLVARGAYQVSKACAEHIISDYYLTYLRQAGKRIAVGRAGNVVIGGDFNSSRRTQGAGRIFVDCYEALADNRAPEIFTPQFTRPYIYGLDVIAGYMALMSYLDCNEVDGEAFNFGPHEQFGVQNSLIATEICRLWGGEFAWSSGRPREEPFQKQSLSWEKAKQHLGWQPAYRIYEALHDTTSWYKEWAARGKKLEEGAMYEFNIALIRAHQQAARSLRINWASGPN